MLSKKDRVTLWRAFAHVEAVRNYLCRDDIAVAIKRKIATTTLDYRRADGAVLTELAKDIGSDLGRIDNAYQALAELLIADRSSQIARGQTPVNHFSTQVPSLQGGPA